MIRILIADDNEMVRQGLDGFLSAMNDMSVIGHACNGIEAVAFCDNFQPDVVLMDLLMPKMDGISATQIIRQRHAAIKIIMLSTYDLQARSYTGIHIGVHGFLTKFSSVDHILETIRAVYNG